MSGPFGSSQWMYKSGGYEIANSLRTPTVNSGYLNITPDASNRRTFTWSFWVKRANHIQYSSTIVDCGGNNNAVFRIQINYATGVLSAYDYNGTSNQYEWTLLAADYLTVHLSAKVAAVSVTNKRHDRYQRSVVVTLYSSKPK